MDEVNDDALRRSLEELRAEINRGDLSSPAAKTRLNVLISGIERKLERPEDEEQHDTLVQNVRDAVGQMELQYPRATSILQGLMRSLGEAGI